MLLAVYTVIIVLLTLPLLAEIRLVIRSILAGSIGAAKALELEHTRPLLQRLTLHGLAPHLNSLHKEYGQYLRLQLFTVLAMAAALLLEVLFIELRQAVPAALVCVVYCVAAFGSISVVHAHAGYDPDKHTTRYNRTSGR